MRTAIVGINWGDEGKGRMVDLLSRDYDIICRYQGGNNAGHTVINDKGKFILNLLPSGILRDGVVNVMGSGMVIDPRHLCGEIETLLSKGVSVTPENLKISDKAFICLPCHIAQDKLEEERLADKKYGSTRRGIAPVYGDKYMKKGLRMGDLLDDGTLEEKLNAMLEWKELTLCAYPDYNSRGDENSDTDDIWGTKTTIDLDLLRGRLEISGLMLSIWEGKEPVQWLRDNTKMLLPFITDTTEYLSNASAENKNIMFEAQLGALRDIDYGIYPYTTSSQTLASYATTGAGIPGMKLDRVVGIMKAYSSCVGEGPFTVEMSGAEADALREAGGEYGAATGRPRRVGAFDVVASRYGINVQGAEEVALTKLDVLSYLDRIPVCTAYEIDGKQTQKFPLGDKLSRAKPVFEYLDGWKTDVSKCRTQESLPKEAVRYIKYIEKAVGCPIRYVSVGAGRNDYLETR